MRVMKVRLCGLSFYMLCIRCVRSTFPREHELGTAMQCKVLFRALFLFSHLLGLSFVPGLKSV